MTEFVLHSDFARCDFIKTVDLYLQRFFNGLCTLDKFSGKIPE